MGFLQVQPVVRLHRSMLGDRQNNVLMGTNYFDGIFFTRSSHPDSILTSDASPSTSGSMAVALRSESLTKLIPLHDPRHRRQVRQWVV